MGEDLTDRQRAILEFVHQHVSDHGYPPTVRDIGDAVGLSSSSSVHAQLTALVDKGYLRRDPTKPRAIELARDPATDLELRHAPTRQVPLVGDVAAGTGVLADENVEDMYALPEELVGDGTLFMLRVRGESMIDAGVLDGDLVVVRQQHEVRNGDMCVAMLPDGEATVKFFRRTRGGEVFLDPANERFEPIPVTGEVEMPIMGKVVSVLRRY